MRFLLFFLIQFFLVNHLNIFAYFNNELIFIIFFSFTSWLMMINS